MADRNRSLSNTTADQSRVLDDLSRDQLVAVLALDATVEQELARALGAVTIPTTALVDRAGSVRRVNLGYFPKDVLAQELAEVH